MKIKTLSIILLFVFMTHLAPHVFGGNKLPDLMRDESPAGARAAMGLLLSPFNKYLTKNVLGLSPHSLAGHAASLTMSAAEYQTIYFDARLGVQVDPFIFKKSWRGFWTGYLAGEGIDLSLHLLQNSEHADIILTSAFFVAMAAITIDGELNNTWRVANDSPLTLNNLLLNRNSYWTHFAATGGLYWLLSQHTKTPFRALLFTMGLAWLWEYKDGYVRTESKFRYLGGDGFSLSDASAGMLAATGSYFLDRLVITPIRYLVLNSTNISLAILPTSDWQGISVGLYWPVN